jgi:hypothetical protein
MILIVTIVSEETDCFSGPSILLSVVDSITQLFLYIHTTMHDTLVSRIGSKLPSKKTLINRGNRYPFKPLTQYIQILPAINAGDSLSSFFLD